MKLISTVDAAYRLGLTPRALYQLIDSRELAAYREGKRVFLDGDEVERFGRGGDGAHDREPRSPIVPRGHGAVSLKLPE